MARGLVVGKMPYVASKPAEVDFFTFLFFFKVRSIELLGVEEELGGRKCLQQ